MIQENSKPRVLMIATARPTFVVDIAARYAQAHSGELRHRVAS